MPCALSRFPSAGVDRGVRPVCGDFGGITLVRVQNHFPHDIVGTATGMITIAP